MNRIYTRSGDSGTTAIHGGSRVKKTDIRIEANGCLDELNVAIGTARSFLPANHSGQMLLKEIQTNLMAAMSIVATPDEIRHKNPNSLPDDCVERIEEGIDKVNETLGENSFFVLPGGSPAASFLHQARVAARRAERRLWELNAEDAVPAIVLKFINRLSDLFFVMAIAEASEGEIGVERWKQFSYKSSKVRK